MLQYDRINLDATVRGGWRNVAMETRIKQLLVGMATPPEWRYLPSGVAGETLRDACYADLLGRLGAAFPDVEGAIVAGEPGVPGVPDATGAADGVRAQIVYLTPEALAASLADDRRTIRRAARYAQERAARRATTIILGRFARHPDMDRLERLVRSRDAAGRMTWTEAAELAEHVARFRPCGIDPATVTLDERADGSFVVLVPVMVTDMGITFPVEWTSPAAVEVGEAFVPRSEAAEEYLAVVG